MFLSLHLKFASNSLIEFNPYGASVHNVICQYPSNCFLRFLAWSLSRSWSWSLTILSIYFLIFRESQMDKIPNLKQVLESVYITWNYFIKGVPNLILGNKGELSKLNNQK